jgi:hypothetical protein
VTTVTVFERGLCRRAIGLAVLIDEHTVVARHAPHCDPGLWSISRYDIHATRRLPHQHAVVDDFGDLQGVA